MAHTRAANDFQAISRPHGELDRPSETLFVLGDVNDPVPLITLRKHSG